LRRLQRDLSFIKGGIHWRKSIAAQRSQMQNIRVKD